MDPITFRSLRDRTRGPPPSRCGRNKSTWRFWIWTRNRGAVKHADRAVGALRPLLSRRPRAERHGFPFGWDGVRILCRGFDGNMSNPCSPYTPRLPLDARQGLAFGDERVERGIRRWLRRVLPVGTPVVPTAAREGQTIRGAWRPSLRGSIGLHESSARSARLLLPALN